MNPGTLVTSWPMNNRTRREGLLLDGKLGFPARSESRTNSQVAPRAPEHWRLSLTGPKPRGG